MNSTPSSEAVKPCPFCGSVEMLLNVERGAGTGMHHRGKDVWYMNCNGCGVQWPGMYAEHGRQSLIEKWNTRAALAAPASPPDQFPVLGYCVLTQVIRSLRETASYTDEEGECTNALEDLANAINPFVSAPASPSVEDHLRAQPELTEEEIQSLLRAGREVADKLRAAKGAAPAALASPDAITEFDVMKACIGTSLFNELAASVHLRRQIAERLNDRAAIAASKEPS